MFPLKTVTFSVSYIWGVWPSLRNEQVCRTKRTVSAARKTRLPKLLHQPLLTTQPTCFTHFDLCICYLTNAKVRNRKNTAGQEATPPSPQFSTFPTKNSRRGWGCFLCTRKVIDCVNNAMHIKSVLKIRNVGKYTPLWLAICTLGILTDRLHILDILKLIFSSKYLKPVL